MLLLELDAQPITIQAERFKVIMDSKQVKVVDINTTEVTIIEAKAFKVPGSPTKLPFELLPEIFDKAFLKILAEKNRLGLSRDQISGSVASWVRKGQLDNENGVYSKTKVISL